MTATQTIESFFTKDQIEVIKATINYGAWGNTDYVFRSGDKKTAYCFCTTDAKNGLKGKFSNKQISGYFAAIERIIESNKFDFLDHERDYWGNGNSSDGMLIFDEDLLPELRDWSKENK